MTSSGSSMNPAMRSRGINEEGDPGPEMALPGHHDTISAVAMSNTCILTGSSDGLLQVWK